MTTRPTTRLVLSLTGSIALTAALTAVGAAPALAAPSAQDKQFVISNAQSNLAEITLGELGVQRANSSGAKELATVTLSDHKRLQALLSKAASDAGYAMPTAPNAMQQATAAKLKATSAQAFDLEFAKAERTGHVLAIAGSEKQTASGSDAAVVAYSKTYTPIAVMHLGMSNAEIAAQGAALPTSVNAGDGGQRAQTTSSTGWVLGLGAGLVLVAASGTSVARRRRLATV